MSDAKPYTRADLDPETWKGSPEEHAKALATVEALEKVEAERDEAWRSAGTEKRMRKDADDALTDARAEAVETNAKFDALNAEVERAFGAILQRRGSVITEPIDAAVSALLDQLGEWKCFACGDAFNVEVEAREHFKDATPKCLAAARAEAARLLGLLQHAANLVDSNRVAWRAWLDDAAPALAASPPRATLPTALREGAVRVAQFPKAPPEADCPDPDYGFAASLSPDEHTDHGLGQDEPDDGDCPCRATAKQTACAKAGCGFCRCSPPRPEVVEVPVKLVPVLRTVLERAAHAGKGPLDRDEFYCSNCRAHHEDFTTIQHAPGCAIVGLLDLLPAIPKVKR